MDNGNVPVAIKNAWFCSETLAAVTTSAGLQREVNEHLTSLAWEPVRSFAVFNKVHRGFERQFITKKEEKKPKTLHLAESRIFFKDR